MNALAGKRFVLVLTGGIACYKAAELCRGLVKAGGTVRVVMTEAAAQFVTPVTMQALSNHPVTMSQWDAREPNAMAHINLTREADAIVVAPCSADFAAKLVQGRADDLASLLCLARPAARVPLVLAPAMNREMWTHAATRRNFAQAAADGAVVLGVGAGDQACGETGDGRMLEPDEILEDLVAALAPKSMTGRRVLVTAGPTYEAIDPVRGLTNRSSGKMGFAIARAAHAAGAEVVLIAGLVALPTPRGVRRIDVRSAREMLAAALPEADTADLFIATAAVADWRPAKEAAQKIKKAGGAAPFIEMVENPDILAAIAGGERARRGALYCVGFAAETESLETHARAKRERKGIPLIVGNLGPATFGADHNTLVLIDAAGSRTLPYADKDSLAIELIAILSGNTWANA